MGELTRIFLTALEERHVKKEPLLVGFFRRKKKVKPGYEVVQNRINSPIRKASSTTPLNILRLFEEALRTGLLIHPDAMRDIAANLHLIDDAVRQNPKRRPSFSISC